VSKVGKIEVQNSQVRALLAEAISERDAMTRAVDQAKAASERANGLVEDAERHAEAVKIALASARDGREKRLRQAVEGGDVIEAAVSRREARFAEIDAADELEAARKVLTSCMAALADAQADAGRAQQRVESAAADVLGGQVERLVSEAASLREQLHSKFEELLWIRTQLRFGGEAYRAATAALPPEPPPGVTPRVFRAPPAWVSAQEALLVSAEASLPT
jgi:DNA repair exonuclease SbcCD ATPase subunit